MKFGLSFMLNSEPWTLTKYIRQAEGLGFDDVYVTDHYFQHDAFVAQTLAALETKTIKIGACVAGVSLRHPCLLASSVATIDNLSGGRAICGLGPGGWEFPKVLCMDYTKPRTACKEAIEIVRGLWRGESVTYSGEIYNVKKARLDIKSRPDIPIILAARGAKMFELAGELCDGSTTHGHTPAYVDFMVKQVGKGAKAAGRDPADIDVAAIAAPFIITDDLDSHREQLRSSLTGFVTGIGSEQKEMLELLDLPYDDVMRVREASRNIKREIVGYAPAPEVVSTVSDKLLDKLLDAFSIVGTAEECLSKVEELEKAGVTHMVALVPSNVEGWKDNIELIGKKIVQSFKS